MSEDKELTGNLRSRFEDFKAAIILAEEEGLTVEIYNIPEDLEPVARDLIHLEQFKIKITRVY